MASNQLNRLRKLEGATNAERPLSPEEFEVSGDSATASKQAQLGSARFPQGGMARFKQGGAAKGSQFAHC